MKIEILFPEFCNLFGDISNMKYLKKCLPNEEYIETSIEDEPSFLNEDIKFIYMGAMTERTQEKVIKKLMPYKEKINELIEKGVVFLCTGNALEIFGKYIELLGVEEPKLAFEEDCIEAYKVRLEEFKRVPFEK